MRQHRWSLTALAAVFAGLFALALAGVGPSALQPSPALADDDGGGDDGGGGGGVGSGGGKGSAGASRGGGGQRASARRSSGCAKLFGVRLGKCKRSARKQRKANSRVARRAVPTQASSSRRTRTPPVELVLLAADAAAADRLTAAGFEVVARGDLTLTGGQVLRLRAPAGLSRRRALARARDAAPAATVAENDLYRPATQCVGDCAPLQLVGWTTATHGCTVTTRVGMVDTGVDATHPLLATARITPKSFRATDQDASGMAHGTAVASVLVGSQGNAFQGLLSGSALLAADAFHKLGREDRADAFHLVLALDWLAAERADVVNMSLTGPDNDVLERVVAGLTGRGTIIIAAAGNDRSTSSGYPGRYPGVVAVAGVDQRLRPLSRAMRGAHISFAAPASGIAVAKPDAATGSESGTSFAAPFVTAAYALAIHKGHARPELEAKIASTARDLGAPGRDRVFGHGLVQLGGLASCK